MKRRFILAGILTIFFYNIDAQDEVPENQGKYNHFLEIGLGTNYHAVRDNGTSPLTYKGYLPAVHLQYFIENKRFLGILNENFYTGNIRTFNNSSSDSKAYSYNNELSFSALYPIKKADKKSVLVGGEIGSLVNVRVNDKFQNADINYEGMLFLAPAATFEYKLSWRSQKASIQLKERNLKFQYGLSVPVITCIVRPGFATIHDFVDDNSIAIDKRNIQVVSFEHMFLIKNRFTLYYSLHNNNMLKLNYDFNYFSYYNHFNPVKGLSSAVTLSIVFCFTNNKI